MYREKLETILEQYVSHFGEMNERGKNKPDAAYKWRVLDAAQKLNLDAEDLLLEFECLAESTSKLMESSRIQPTGGITILLQHDEETEFVRNAFKKLLADDGGDIDARQGRVEDFIDDINRHLSMYLEKIDIYRQTLNSAIGYLSLLRPSENYFYKPTVADSWAMSIEFSEDFGHAKTFSLRKYYKMCDELREVLQEFPDVIALHEKRMQEEEIQTDDDLHMLVYDIMFCCDAYSLDPNKEKMTVKERLSRAVIREERDSLMDKLLAVEERLQTLGTDFELPDPVGEKVTHKTFGEGVITACNDGRMNIDFGNAVKKFQYPDAFAKGFLITENAAYMSRFQEKADMMTERRQLEREKLRLEDSLRHIG